jgi:glutamate 5-kinase
VRLVVKVGSSTLMTRDGGLDVEAMAGLARQLGRVANAGHEVVLVSSGAVGGGRGVMGGAHWSRAALAAVGQPYLMSLYQEMLRPRLVGQVLVLQSDLTGAGAAHLQETLAALLAHGVVPVVNENDATSHGASSVGENDTVAGVVADLVAADLLVLLSDIDGVYDRHPKLPGSTFVAELDPSGARMLAGYTDGGVHEAGRFGRGGMASKLQAAARLAEQGIVTVIADGRETDVLVGIAEGRPIGTRVVPAAAPAGGRVEDCRGYCRFPA